MGSFDYTCSISRLPITVGNTVRLVLLQNALDSHNEDGNRGLYPISWWWPWSFPLRAVYNDHGNFVVSKDTDTWTALLRGQILRRPEGKNPYHQPAVHRDLDFQDLQWAVSTSRLLARLGTGTPRRYSTVSFTAIHDKVWDYLVMHGKKIHPSPTKKEIDDLRAGTSIKDVDWKTGLYLFGELYSGHARCLERAFTRARKQNPSENFWADVEGIAHVEKAMGRLRLMWLPSCSIGWQHGELKAAAAMHKEFARIAASLRPPTLR